MPPEQANGDLTAIDERSDIFSLGAIIYEILTGKYHIPGKSLQEMVINARKCEIQPPDERVDFPIPKGLVRITMKAMSRDPADRYQSVEEPKNALESFLDGSERFREADQLNNQSSKTDRLTTSPFIIENIQLYLILIKKEV